MTGDTFKALLETYDLLLLDFHAPWCPHCQRFAPVWEHAAELVGQRLASAPSEAKLGMGSVDCTTAANLMLCREQHIQAFPTVRIYRRGRNALDSRSAADAAAQHYEAYNGDRSAEAVADFAVRALEQASPPSLSTSGANQWRSYQH